MGAKWMMETFPNYTEDMWNGNEPNYYGEGINGNIAHYSCRYGCGEVAPDGTIIHAQISLDKLNTIYIVGNYVKLMHIPYDGVPHYWYWEYKDGVSDFYVHGKDCLPKYPKDYVNRLMKKKRDFDGTYLYEVVKKYFMEMWNITTNEILSNYC